MAWQVAARRQGMALPTLEMLSEGRNAEPVVELGIEPRGIGVEVKRLFHAFTVTPLPRRCHGSLIQLPARAAAAKQLSLSAKGKA